LVNLCDLLELLPKRKGGGGSGAPIHSAAAKFLAFVETTPEETPIHLLETEQERFVDYLRNRRHTPETVRSYRFCLNRLLKEARERGWQTPPQILPSDWAEVMALAGPKEVQSIVRFAARIKKSPSIFGEDDLRVWCQERIQAGRTLSACRTNVSLFRALISRPELVHLRPAVQAAPVEYGTPLRKMHPSLRMEIEQLLSFLADDLEFDRPGAPLRPASIQGRQGNLERLVGFVENIQGRSRIETLSDVLNRNVVTQYIKWAVKERGVLGETLFTGISGIRAAVKKHPRYADLDLSWLSADLGKLRRVTQAEIDGRKEPKYIRFETANAIPGKIREARARVKNQTAQEVALSIRNELIMLWLVVLPWRQRNLRECRLAGGPHPNLYHAAIPRHSSVTQPGWLLEQEKVHPGMPVWQIYFSKNETKSKNETRGFLPYELATLLEEYLGHRAALIPAGDPDPGTLFLNEEGNAMNQSGFRSLVESLSSIYAGKAVNPHLFRDIVAYEWLEHHPHDYLTLSKVLWHKTAEQTLKVYGSRFNESTGIARMDDWRASRREPLSKQL
jgi:hypothetical protein